MNKAKVKPSKSASFLSLVGGVGLIAFFLTVLFQVSSYEDTPLPILVGFFILVVIAFIMTGWHFLNITKKGGMSHTEIDFERKISKAKKK